MAKYPQQIEIAAGDRRITYVLQARSDEPVYADAGTGGTATASGRVWVRFAAGTDARDRAEDFANAGYAIEDVPGHAPNAAYVRAADTAASLHGLDELRAIAGVEHVEPEMLRARTFRE